MEVHRERLCEFSRLWEADATAVSSLLALQQQQQALWSIADASAVSVAHGALFLRGNDVSTSSLQISIGLDGNKTLHRLSLRTQLPQDGATLKLQLPEQYGHITMAIGTTSNSSEMFIGSSQNTSVVAELPCVTDVTDAYHDVEFVWDDQWLRWYVDETLLLEEFIFQTKESKNSRIELELSVEGSDVTLAVERMTLSSGNASDRYCMPRYSTSSNCRVQESLSPRLGSVQGSLSVAEVEAFIDEVAAAFPIITKVEELGRSVEGRPLRALCLGACYAPEDQMTPQALFTGMHHAREPVSMMNLVYTIDILTTDYRNGDLAALELLASRQLWFILVVNPDGYAHNEMARVWEHNKMGQRKSGAPTCDRSPPDAGVDLNRNYDVCFARDAKGSSNKPCGDDYNGPSAFSEPETQAVSDLVERNTTDFSVALNYHSYGKYFNLPFACQAEGEPTEPNNSVFRALAQEMAYFNGFSYGQSWKDSNLYTVNGETSDWMWQAHGIFAMSPEVGPGFEVQSVPGFWPPPDQIPQLSSELHYSNLYISRMAGPVYSLVVKGVQLGAIGDGGDISSFVSVDVTVGNIGLRSAAAELIGSVFMNGTSTSDIVRLDLQAEPEGAEGLEKTYTVMIPYSSEDFQQSMREIKDLYLVVRDTFSCHLFRVAIHFHTDVERANRPSFQMWRALPLPRCGTCELFGASADRDNPMTQASPVCNEIKDVTFLKPIRTRIVDSKTVTINSSRPASTSSAVSSGPKAQIDQQTTSTSILPSSVSWSGPVAMASLAGFTLLVVLILFVRRRRGKKKPSRKKATSGVHKRRTVQYARIDEDVATPKDRQLKYDDDEDFDLVDAEYGEGGASVVSRSRSSSQDIV